MVHAIKTKLYFTEKYIENSAMFSSAKSKINLMHPYMCMVKIIFPNLTNYSHVLVFGLMTVDCIIY